MPRSKKSVENVPVAATEEVVTDIEESPVKEVVYTFQTLGYVFMVGAIAAAVAWFIYLAQWVTKVYNDDRSYSTDQIEDGAGSGDHSYIDRKAGWSFEVTTLCFQALVASCLLYLVFRHHYRHH